MQKSNKFKNDLDFILILFGSILLCVMVALLTSCKQVEYVTVPEVHHEYHHTTDSVHQIDSVIDHQTTIIKEVDSATMAQYGIKLASAQRAWLVQNERLLKEIEKLKEASKDTIHVADSVPYPVPVEVIKEVKYTPWYAKILAWIGGIVLAMIGITLIWKYVKIA